MKNYLSLLLLIGAKLGYSQCATYTSAVSDVTLQTTGGTGNRSAIAYFPTKNMYYSVNAGSGSYPIESYTYTGGAALGFTPQVADYRGLWYNFNLGTIEGNSFGSGGIFRHDINQVTGNASGTAVNVNTSNMPNSQSCGAYDPINNHVLYYDANTLYKYNRTTGALVTSMAITGLPAGNINTYGILYTGIAGQEVGVYDYTNLAVRFINYTTGAYVSSCQLPVGAPAPSSFRFGYANNRIFLYNGTNQWYGYKITNQSDLLFSGNNFACSAQPATITVSGASTYTWSTASNAASIAVTPSVTTMYSVAATNSAGCTSTSNFIVSIGTTPTMSTSVSGTFFCGSGTTTLTASGATTYTWSTASNSGTIVETPTATTVYTVTGSNGGGCYAVQTISVIIESNPTITVNSGNVCSGSSFTMVPNGASTYTFEGGSAVVTPTANTSYTVIGSSPGGCLSQNFATSNVTVNPTPTVTAITSNSIICGPPNQGTVVLTAGGANTYTWNTSATGATIAVSPSVTTSYTVIGMNTEGCTAQSVITQSVSNCTGINALSGANDLAFKIYPNPSSGVFVLELESITNVIVTDLMGKIVYSQQLQNGNHKINLENTMNGIYILKLEENGNLKTVKLIKE